MSNHEIEKTHTQATESARFRPEQQKGMERLRRMLPVLADFYDPSDSDERDVCRACHSCECGGACPSAMEIVRQIIEDLGCGDDSWEWWIDYFAATETPIPAGGGA